MTRMNLENVVRNIDRRLERVEQILPTLPTREDFDHRFAALVTRDELDQRLAALVTRDELDQRLAALPTRDEMHAAIRDAVAPLAARMDGFDRRLTEESERSRRYTQILFESLRDDIRLVAEGVATLQTTMEEAVRPMLADHERRITTLEDSRGPANGSRPRRSTPR